MHSIPPIKPGTPGRRWSGVETPCCDLGPGMRSIAIRQTASDAELTDSVAIVDSPAQLAVTVTYEGIEITAIRLR